MAKGQYIAWFIILLFHLPGESQTRYEISKVPFSTSRYDEFCPMPYGDEIVFCSNREHDLLINYQDADQQGFFHLFKVSIDSLETTRNPSNFSAQLTTPLNDGPVSFHPNGNQLVYSKNL
jgi:hypothetical protein